MRYSKWYVNGFDRDAAVEFCRRGVNPLASVFLVSRGVGNIDDAREILGVSPAEVHDPFLMADMEKAAARIKAAVSAGERIAVYGDYDVDGMTSCALLAQWLRSKNADYEIYIPGRVDEGYGLSCPALDILKSRGAGLVITVDCGITAIREAQYARSIGLGLVITDHHETRNELPVADAVVDPKRRDCVYPNKALAGVGVAFKLVCALEGDFRSDEMFHRYGDLVAVGTIADVMPVGGENRELIGRGLHVLNNAPRLGFLQLIKEFCADRSAINTATVGYVLAPRLNAAGRMSKPELSVELLLTDSGFDAERLTAELNQLNAERRKLEVSILDEAEAMLPEGGPDGPIVLSRRGWYQGVTGIVAAKLAERYFVPALIISIDNDGVGRGSCRSIEDFGIYSALRSCEDLLKDYGGHEMASGLTISEENIDEFRLRVTRYYHSAVSSYPRPGLHLDFEVEKPELLELRNVEALTRLEPFGNDNPPPCMCIKGARAVSVQSIGAGLHTRMRIEKSGKTLDCIFFSTPLESLGVAEGTLVDIAFEPQINEFRGRTSVQLQLFDIREAEI